ncbi:hypothetical protein [Botryobacter ruber]|uniref:hypothetical protein n=1 Tax=Botryobacter ruber TaxID=2171629 RepID=UPI000F654159|nr:hypothetical protein [Botryobacter ruber]
MALSTRISFSNLTVKTLVVVLLLYGFITNFLSFTSINLSTLLTDFLFLLMLAHLLLVLAYSYLFGLSLNKYYFFYTVFWLLLLLLTTLKLIFLDENPFPERVLGLRNNLIYSTLLIYLPLMIKDEGQIKSIFKIFLFFSLLLVGFSIIQFVFSSQLPRSLLVLRGEGRFGFFGTDIVRPTALLGNTIIYASFTIILFSYYLSKYIFEWRKKYLLVLLLITAANILTFTRATLVGILIVLLVILYLRYARFSIKFLMKGFFTIALLVTLILSAGYYYRDTFLVQRVIGKEASSKMSTNVHIIQIINSIKYLQKKPLVGAGVGTQGPSGNDEKKIITDGFWFQLFLENGMLLGSLYLLFYISCVIFAFRTFYKTTNLPLKQICMSFVAISAYFYSANFINSALAGRVNFVLYWLFFGLLLAQYLIVKKNSRRLI